MRALALVVVAGCGRLGFDAVGDAPTVHAGPVGWWKLDDGAGTAAIDSSGEGNTGTLTDGLTWVTGQIGGAIMSDGGQDHTIDLGDPPVLRISGSITLAAWVNASSFNLDSSTDDAIIARDDFHNSGPGWALKGSEDCGPQHFVLEIGVSGSGVERCSNLVPPTGMWFHVAGVYDAAAREMHIYIDGSVDDGTLTDVVPAAQAIPATHAQIGNANPGAGKITGGGNGFNGIIDDVRIYDRPLDAAEIAGLAL